MRHHTPARLRLERLERRVVPAGGLTIPEDRDDQVGEAVGMGTTASPTWSFTRDDAINLGATEAAGAEVTFAEYAAANAQDVDLYKVTVAAGDRLRFQVATFPTQTSWTNPPRTPDKEPRDFRHEARVALMVFDAAGRLVDTLGGDPVVYTAGTDGTYDLTYTFHSAGDYHLGVSNHANRSYSPASGSPDQGSSTAFGPYRLTAAYDRWDVPDFEAQAAGWDGGDLVLDFRVSQATIPGRGRPREWDYGLALWWVDAGGNRLAQAQSRTLQEFTSSARIPAESRSRTIGIPAGELGTPPPGASAIEFAVNDDSSVPELYALNNVTRVGVPRGQLRVSATSLDFGDVTQTRTADRELTITNSGPSASRLVVTIGSPDPEFQVLAVGGQGGRYVVELAGGESTTLLARYAPAPSFGRHSSNLMVSAYTPDNPSFAVGNAVVVLSGRMAPLPTGLSIHLGASLRHPGDLPVHMRFNSTSGRIRDFFPELRNGHAWQSDIEVREVLWVKQSSPSASPSDLPDQDPAAEYIQPPPFTGRNPNPPGGYKDMPTWGEATLTDEGMTVNAAENWASFYDGHGQDGIDVLNPPSSLVAGKFTVVQRYEFRLPWHDGGNWTVFGPTYEITREVYQNGTDSGGRPIWYYQVTKLDRQTGVTVSGAPVRLTSHSPLTTTLLAAGAGPGGSADVTLYPPRGAAPVTLRPFAPAPPGGVRVAVADFNGDGTEDVVAGTGPGVAARVRILDGATGAELFALDAFEPSFLGGVYVAAGDLSGDGHPDLVVTPDEGGGPRVRVFSGRDYSLVADFFAIDDPNFRGGARAGVGDLNGDGVGDLLVSAGFGGGPRVAGYDGRSVGGSPVKLFADFFAFEDTLRNGVYLAVGDVTGDGFAELVVGGGPGGGPRVSAFDGRTLAGGGGAARTIDFFAGGVANRGGVRVALKNLDDDAHADLIAGAGSGAGSRVTAYAGKGLAAGTQDVLTDGEAFPGGGDGVFVG
jgi:hypothetical protein